MVKDCYVIVDVKAGDVFETILTAQYKEQARDAFHMEWEYLTQHDKDARTSFELVTANVYEGGIIDYETVKLVEKIK